MSRRGQALLLEIIVGLLIILGVVLVVATLFPTSYQGTLQAARMTAAVNLARQAIERQKHDPEATAFGNQTVDSPFQVQGRNLVCRFFYRMDRASTVGADPILWQTTVQWENSGQIKEIILVGANAPP